MDGLTHEFVWTGEGILKFASTMMEAPKEKPTCLVGLRAASLRESVVTLCHLLHVRCHKP